MGGLFSLGNGPSEIQFFIPYTMELRMNVPLVAGAVA